MVMHPTSYDVLVGGVVLYPLGFTIDFLEEIDYYYLGWQTRTNHKGFITNEIHWRASKKM